MKNRRKYQNSIAFHPDTSIDEAVLPPHMMIKSECLVKLKQLGDNDSNMYLFKDLSRNIMYTTKLIKCYDVRGKDEEDA